MKHNPNPKRGRSRSSGKRGPSGKGRNFESSGSDNKIRGTAQQVLDKYLNLARDAHSSGDRIMAENYYQFAEHYYRIVNANNDGDEQGSQNRQGSGQNHGDNRGQAKEQAAVTKQGTSGKDGNGPVSEDAPNPDSEEESTSDSEANSAPSPEPESIPA